MISYFLLSDSARIVRWLAPAYHSQKYSSRCTGDVSKNIQGLRGVTKLDGRTFHFK
jgi:hypothetical protein